MKPRHLAFLTYALIGAGPAPACPPETDPDETSQPWLCGDYEAEGEKAPKGCVREPGRDTICGGPTENIPDDDPALELFRGAEPDNLEARKVALAIERANSCD